MFAQLSSGEVVGLVASFMFCAITSYIIWSQLVKCYKQRLLLLTSLSKAQSSVGSGMMRIASGSSLFGNDGNNHDENDNDMEMPPSSSGRNRRGGNNNPQKDKMVATLLVQMRTQEEQQRRLELGGLTTTATPGSNDTDEKKQPTIVNLSSSSTDTSPVLINRSDLPPLPDGGRVLAVMGAHIVEDERNGGTSVTSATHTAQSFDMSEFTSPLFQDDDEERNCNGGRNNLRLRRHLE